VRVLSINVAHAFGHLVEISIKPVLKQEWRVSSDTVGDALLFVSDLNSQYWRSLFGLSTTLNAIDRIHMINPTHRPQQHHLLQPYWNDNYNMMNSTHGSDNIIIMDQHSSSCEHSNRTIESPG